MMKNKKINVCALLFLLISCVSYSTLIYTNYSVFEKLSYAKTVDNIIEGELTPHEDFLNANIKKDDIVKKACRRNGGIAGKEIDTKGPLSFNRWWFGEINGSTAWNYTTGNQSIKIGILDDGIQYDHPNIGNLDTSNSVSYVSGLSALTPTNSHGTLMAGLITGTPSSSYPDLYGIAPNCSVVSIRILNQNDCLTNPSILANAITYAGNHNINILVLSYTLEQSEMTSTLITAINNYNGIIFCAAGNDYYSLDCPPTGNLNGLYQDLYPSVSGFNNVVSIAATDQQHYCSSNFGPISVDFGAPGKGLWSTSINSNVSMCNGSSFAAPIAAGAFALLKSCYSNLLNGCLINILKNSLSTMNTGIAYYNDLCSCYQTCFSIIPDSAETSTNGILNIGAAMSSGSSHLIYTPFSSTQHSIHCSCSQPVNYGNQNHTFQLVMNMNNNPDYIPSYECIYCGYTTNFPSI